MRRLLLSLLAFVPMLLSGQNISVSTNNTQLVLKAEKGSPLGFAYYGPKVGDADGLSSIHSAYPAYGMDCRPETAIAVRHSDGDLTLDLVVEGTSSEDGATVVEMKDRVYPFRVKVFYKSYPSADMIETWTEISHEEASPVVLLRFDSAYLPIRRGDVWMSYLYGTWANEARLVEEPVRPGLRQIKNKDGVRNTHTSHPEVMFSLDGKPSENEGRVIGAALCYNGNYQLRVDTDDTDYHHFFAGINPDNSFYYLEKGEVFSTPAVALTYSDRGKSGVSRNFHRWARSEKLSHGDVPRKILLNSWEGVYFSINEQTMDQMMGDISSMGGELFVMDDGWFGDKYPRNNDSSSLGDWVVDRRKLPGGIASLVRMASSHGIDFGIWIEPEMTNTVSELYEKHPDWVVKPVGREPVTGRGGTQLVLDLSNPEVQDFVFSVVDNIMIENPQIKYIKWDANMPIMSQGSQYLPSDRQSHLYIEYHRGLINVCKRVREKYPDLVIQCCASGGGRANYGILPYFDEFWVSDNTDALQRVYMQWGTSHFFPAIAMASHVSASPNHQTGRTIPIKYRIDVAMSGRLGLEIQPRNMTEDEVSLCKRAISQYKDIRDVVQFGDIYRLISPYDDLGVASLMYVAPDRGRAVFFWWKMEHFCDQHLPRVRMSGLDPSRTYTVRELDRIDSEPLPFEGKSFSGEYLMNVGLDIPVTHKVPYPYDYASRVLSLE